jgi:hypothetical protein
MDPGKRIIREREIEVSLYSYFRETCCIHLQVSEDGNNSFFQNAIPTRV